MWKPDIPARDSPVVLYDNLKVLELADGNCVEGDIKQDEGPFEEGVDGVCCTRVSIEEKKASSIRTPGNMMDLVLDEEVDERHQRRKEGTCK